MIKLIFMLKRKAGLSSEQFRQHYESSREATVMMVCDHVDDAARLKAGRSVDA